MPDRRTTTDHLGPVLYLQGVAGTEMKLSVLHLRPRSAPMPAIRTAAGSVVPRVILAVADMLVWQAVLTVAPEQPWYESDGHRLPVAAELTGDLDIAFVSCNGREHHDSGRGSGERNLMWRRLLRRHREAPLNLLLQGGDQVYADEVLHAEARLAAWHAGRPAGRGSIPATEERRIRDRLERAFLARYAETLAHPETAALMAEVPSLAMWDDHDICDGWGSLREDTLDAPAGRLLFDVARRMFLVFQRGIPPDETMPGGDSLSWHVALPGVDILAPDLRSERRPDRVMGAAGWAALDGALARARAPRTILLSSVPALGPRLSLLEGLLHIVPRAQKYEDDLRDQWQSRTHRAEWRRFLSALVAHHESGRAVTLLSGEIHLATRATLATATGPVHQLVASGISHPAPPRAWAWTLGALARLGESPLPGHPIRLHALPGRRGIYRAERNFLILERRGRRWQAFWDLEYSGATAAMAI